MEKRNRTGLKKKTVSYKPLAGIESAKNCIAEIPKHHAEIEEQLFALAKLRKRAFLPDPIDPEVTLLIDKEMTRALSIISGKRRIELDKKAKAKGFSIPNTFIGNSAFAFDKRIWAAAVSKNPLDIEAIIKETEVFAKKMVCQDFFSQYLESLSEKALDLFGKRKELQYRRAMKIIATKSLGAAINLARHSKNKQGELRLMNELVKVERFFTNHKIN